MLLCSPGWPRTFDTLASSQACAITLDSEIPIKFLQGDNLQSLFPGYEIGREALRTLPKGNEGSGNLEWFGKRS